MEPFVLGIIFVGVLMVMLFIGMPVAFGAALTGFIGLLILAGPVPALDVVGTTPWAKITTYSFTVIPLFVLMGYFAFGAGLATQAFETGKKWVGHIRGGLAMATIFACACFAACSGVTVATAALFGKMAVPEMERQGIKSRLAAGVVAASGTFSCMIPPSGIMVIYAIMAEVSIGKQLIAGIFPGLITAVLYGGMLVLMTRLDPKLAPVTAKPAPWKERLTSTPKLGGILLLALIIMGGIYTGIFTPTEAGAIGAFTAFLMLMIVKRNKAGQTLKQAFLDTGRTTGMIAAVLFGIIIFAHFLALSRLTYVMIEWIGSLDVSRYVILGAIVIFYIILGMFFEAVGMLILSIPFILPIIVELGFDPIWFGIFAVKNVEIGLVTPPVGITVYVVKGVCPHIPLEEIFKGIFPFILMDILVLVLLAAFPQIALFLPSLM